MKLNVIVVHRYVDGIFRNIFEKYSVIACGLQKWTEPAAAVAVAPAAGGGRFGDHLKSAGAMRFRSRKNAGREAEDVFRPEGIGPRFHAFIVDAGS